MTLVHYVLGGMWLSGEREGCTTTSLLCCQGVENLGWPRQNRCRVCGFLFPLTSQNPSPYSPVKLEVRCLASGLTFSSKFYTYLLLVLLNAAMVWNGVIYGRELWWVSGSCWLLHLGLQGRGWFWSWRVQIFIPLQKWLIGSVMLTTLCQRHWPFSTAGGKMFGVWYPQQINSGRPHAVSKSVHPGSLSAFCREKKALKNPQSPMGFH